MSIVLDALNKAEQQRNRGVLRSDGDRKLKDLKSTYHRVLWVIVTVNVALVSAGAAYFLAGRSGDAPPGPSARKASAPAPTAVARAAVPSRPENPVDPERFIVYKRHLEIENGPSLDVNGVFEDDGSAFVLVGEDMFEAGDRIGEFTVKEVSLDEVKVQYKGRVYEIPT
jgi:hypothetical protein